MPLPLLLLGAASFVGAALTVDHLNEQRRNRESKRMDKDDLDLYLEGSEAALKLPSEVLTSDILVKPVPGAIVSCSVFSAFDHTGIWLDEQTIVELHGTGLIKGVTPARFLSKRSGNAIFVACDSKGEPLTIAGAFERSVGEIYNFREYDFIDNNCYRFTWYCASGEDKVIKSFNDFNRTLAQHHGKTVYWDRADM